MLSKFLPVAILALASAAAGPAMAQDGPWKLHDAVGAPDALKLTGSFRARYENLDNTFRTGDDSDSLVSLRTLIFAEYDTGNYRFGGELQDSRAYRGTVNGAAGAGEVNALEPIQAYVARDFAAPFGAGSEASLLFGRTTLNLGSRRLVAADDFRNATNGYTGLRFDAKTANGFATTLIYAMPQIRLPDDKASVLDNEVKLDHESLDQVLWGGLVSKSLGKGKPLLEASFYGFDEKDAPGRATRDREFFTAGLRAIQDPAVGAFDYEAEVMHQWGDISASTAANAANLDVSASFYHLDAGYSFKGPWKVRASVEYDHVSGEDSKASYGRFDTLFGMRSADFGPSGIYAAIGRANIKTIGLRVEANPTKRLNAHIVYRGMWAESQTDTFSTTGVRAPVGYTDDYAGENIETRIRYWVIPDDIRLDVNGVLLLKSPWFDDVNRDNAEYVAVALTKVF